MRARWLTLLLLLAVPSVVRADLPPPEGYVETCTPEKQCKSDEDASSCGANYSDHEKCKKLHASDGYVYRCRTNGASVWTEIWCRPKRKATPPKKK